MMNTNKELMNLEKKLKRVCVVKSYNKKLTKEEIVGLKKRVKHMKHKPTILEFHFNFHMNIGQIIEH